MENKSRLLKHRLFAAAFVVLTFFCWCPWGYGRYGEAQRILGVPSWVVWAFVFGAVLFLVEWIYLFFTGLAIDDRDLSDILSELESIDTEAAPSEKDGESCSP